MVKIIHGADFHLDSPFDALPPEKAQLRRSEQRKSVMALAELAQQRESDVVLLSGDLFDSENAFYETGQMLRDVLGGMKAQVFIAPGNHDYYSPGSPYRTLVWPDNVHIFASSRIQCVELPEINCRVYGGGFVSPAVHHSMLSDFTADRDGMVNIMVLHGDTAAVTDNYDPISREDIAASGLDYLALGHIHKFSGILRSGETDYAYPGCPEGRGFDETGDKGVIAGTVEKGKTELEFVKTCLRRYVEVQADYESLLAGNETVTADADDIVRLTLTGSRDGDCERERVREMFEDSFFHFTLRDRTVRRRDVWESAGEDSLKGMFLRDLRESYNASPEEKKKVILLAAQYGLAAIDNGEEPQV